MKDNLESVLLQFEKCEDIIGLFASLRYKFGVLGIPVDNDQNNTLCALISLGANARLKWQALEHCWDSLPALMVATYLCTHSTASLRLVHA